MAYDDRYYKNEGMYSWCVYILYLEDEKWYVGLTHDVDRRFEEHCEGRGAEWTRIHKPIEVVHIWQTSFYKRAKGEDIENKATIEMMKVFGRSNVRGGYYVAVEQAAVDEMLGEDLCEELDNLFIRRGRKYFEELVKPNLTINKFDEISSQERRKKKLGSTNRAFYIISADNREIHIKFPKRPPLRIRDEMKSNGWTFNGYASYWQNRFNDKNLIFAKEICGEGVGSRVEEQYEMNEDSQDNESVSAWDFMDYESLEDNDFEEELSTEEWGPLFEESDVQKAEYFINRDKHRIEIYFYRDPGNDIKSLLYADKWHYYGAKHFWHRKFSYKTMEERVQFAEEICEAFNKAVSICEKTTIDDLPFN